MNKELDSTTICQKGFRHGLVDDGAHVAHYNWTLHEQVDLAARS